MSAIAQLPVHARALHVQALGADDRKRFAEAFARLSARSRLQRYLYPKARLTPEELTRFCEVDHHRDEALAAREADGRIVAVARYASAPGQPGTAEVAFEVADEWHGRGLATALLRAIVERARANRFDRLTATTMFENRGARRVLHKAGFFVSGCADGLVDLALDLDEAVAAAA